jgi:hypothetical protein
MHKTYIGFHIEELNWLLKYWHTQYQHVYLVIMQLLTVNSTCFERCNSTSKNVPCINDKSGLLPWAQKYIA